MVAFVAVDLGATSGRVILGQVDGGVHLTELHRFPNGPVERPGGGLRWDIHSLHQNVLTGLHAAAPAHPVSIGIDSWAVDYGLIDSDGRLDGDVRCYRDPRTTGMAARLRTMIDDATLYRINGLQYLPFNTIYQLLAEPPDRLTDHTLLLIPDLIAYWLTGCLGAELTNASTTGLLDATTRTWSTQLLSRTNIPATLLPPLRHPGDLIGPGPAVSRPADFPAETPSLTRTTQSSPGSPPPHPAAKIASLAHEHPPPVPGGDPTPIVSARGVGEGRETGGCGQAEGCGYGSRQGEAAVIAVGSHDTASAVAAIPVVGERFGYVSCGTWSLVGLVLPAPVLTDAARLANFTNESGVDGTVRFLRNTMGLWLVNESVRVWGARLGPLLAGAAREPALAALIDPNDEVFLAPGDMPARITGWCQRTGQEPPRTPAGTVRTILESLALAHAVALWTAAELAGRELDTVHLVGGGARNGLLCQLTADACGLPVLAGPVEASALGNILVQARAAGVDAAPGQPFARYRPRGGRDAWRHAARRIGLETRW